MKYLLSLVLLAQVTYADSESVSQVNFKMNRIGKSMQKLFPYMFNSEKFSSSKNEKIILKEMKNILSNLESAEDHFKEDKPVTYQLGGDVLISHTKETIDIFKNGKKSFAQSMLKASTHLCMSCHTQDNTKRKLFRSMKRKSFSDDFAYAEFNFMTRNYNEALKYYNKFISTSNNKKRIGTALKRKLTIFAGIQKSPQAGISSFNKDIARPNLGKMNAADVALWIKGLEKWKKSDELKYKKLDEKTVTEIAKKFLFPLKNRSPFAVEGVDTVTYVRLRNMMNDYLNKGPKESMMPKVLYWLALSDKALDYSIFYSLSNTYLKTCIKRYNKYPAVKDCFDEYEENITFSFTGSGGTFIPKDIQMELDQFKRLIREPMKK